MRNSVRMKQYLMIFFLLLPVELFSQSSFIVEGKNVPLGKFETSYEFGYTYDDSLKLYFLDSIVLFKNPKGTIVKSVSRSAFDDKAYTTISYFKDNGKDSVSKHLNGKKISMLYTTLYDSLDRIKYYALKDYEKTKTNDRSFEWTYEYRDSTTKNEIINIQTIFVKDAAGPKRYHFRVLNFYDKKNRKTKEIREEKTNDPFAQIIYYKYDEKDSLIEKNVYGQNMLPSHSVNTPCFFKIEKEFGIVNFTLAKELIESALKENRNKIVSNECENLVGTYYSADKSCKLIIEKSRPYREGRRAYYIKSKQFGKQ